MKEEWEQSFPKTLWLQLTIELIRGLGSIQLKDKPRWMNEACIERAVEAIWIIWTLRNNQIFNKRVIPERLAIKEALWTKKETEWIYITKIKGLSIKDKETVKLRKKWGKEIGMTNN